jgi:coenzyme PQQ biosynthesis protein PqqD
MIPAEARPRLARMARLRFDRHAQRHMLLYPERGLALNASAAAIAQLCTGELSLTEIVDRLHAANRDATRDEIESGVQLFLNQMRERMLIELD